MNTIGFTLPPSRRDPDPRDALRNAANHLAVAASELARDPRHRPDDRKRFALAESRFRAQAADLTGLTLGPAPPVPGVFSTAGDPLPLTALFADALLLDQRWHDARSIDGRLVEGAKELLLGFRWTLADVVRQGVA